MLPPKCHLPVDTSLDENVQAWGHILMMLIGWSVCHPLLINQQLAELILRPAFCGQPCEARTHMKMGRACDRQDVQEKQLFCADIIFYKYYGYIQCFKNSNIDIFYNLIFYFPFFLFSWAQGGTQKVGRRLTVFYWPAATELKYEGLIFVIERVCILIIKKLYIHNKELYVFKIVLNYSYIIILVIYTFIMLHIHNTIICMINTYIFIRNS